LSSHPILLTCNPASFFALRSLYSAWCTAAISEREVFLPSFFPQEPRDINFMTSRPLFCPPSIFRRSTCFFSPTSSLPIAPESVWPLSRCVPRLGNHFGNLAVSGWYFLLPLLAPNLPFLADSPIYLQCSRSSQLPELSPRSSLTKFRNNISLPVSFPPPSVTTPSSLLSLVSL